MQVGFNFGRPSKLGVAASQYGLSSSVVDVRKVTDKVTGFGGKVMNQCQSSFSMAEVIVLTWADRGDHVLDLCSGVGSIPLACAVNGINCTAIEADPTQCRIIESRLGELQVDSLAAFDKPVKIPQADMVDCANAPSQSTEFPADTPGAKTVFPYRSSGGSFSNLSFKAFDRLLVS
jgi:hypothetical protein